MSKVTIRLFWFAIVALLLFFPFTATASNTISSNSTHGITPFEITTSAWSQPTGANLSLSTSAGTTIIIASIEARVNSTGGKLLGRIVRDGNEIQKANLTEITYISNSPMIAVFTETEGYHTYGLELYNPAGKKTFVNNWTLGVTSVTNGAYLTEGITNVTAYINISQVSGLQGQQDAQNESSQNKDDLINSTKLNKTDLNSTVNFYTGNSSNLTGTINYSTIPALPQANVSGLVNDLANIRTNNTNQANYLNNTYPGSSSITTVGTIVTGVWHGTSIDAGYIVGIDTIKSDLANNVSYFNGTYFPNSTNFRNDSLQSEINATRTAMDIMNQSRAANDTAQNNSIISLQNNESAFVTTSNNSYVLTSNSSYVKTDNLSYVLTSNLTYPRTAISNGTSTNLTYSSSTGVFDILLPVCASKLLSSASGVYCGTDLTSSFSIRSNSNPLITGSARLLDGTGVSMTQSGNDITINVPAAGITNTSVNPQTMNASNLTSGTVAQVRLPNIPEANLSLTYPTHAQNHSLNGTDHTGFLNWSRINNVTVNLSATGNLTGLLPDAFIQNAAVFNDKVDVVSGVDALVATEAPANTVTLTCNQASGTQTGCLDYTNFTAFFGKPNMSVVNSTMDKNASNLTGTIIHANNNVTISRSLDTLYTNSNSQSMQVFVTARVQITLGAGMALLFGNSTTGQLSGRIGSENGLLNEDVTEQLVFVVAPGKDYTVNTTTSNGVITLRDWREVLI